MTIDFYYVPGSASCRIVQVTAKLLDIHLNPKILDIKIKKHQLTAEFLKINPQHCVPTIVDNGFPLWECNAIATYLIQQYGKDDTLYPKEPEKRAVIDQRLHFNNGLFLRRLIQYCIPVIMGLGTFDAEKREKIAEVFEFLESFLEGNEYTAGDFFSVADISLGATVSTYLVAKFDIVPYKNVTRWYHKLQTSVAEFEEVNNVEMLSEMYEAYRLLR